MDIEREINDIKRRNKRVEIEKAWEVSRTRRVSIAVLTYIVIVIIMFIFGMPAPFMNAIIPVAGFILSTLGLRFIKNVWMRIISK